jgi:hypothetical protein
LHSAQACSKWDRLLFGQARFRERRQGASGFHGHAGTVDHHLLHLHLVDGDGAGLVQADGLDRSQRFHGLQAAHQHVVLAHPANAQSQVDGGGRRQPFGDGGCGQGNGGARHLHQSVAAQQADQETRRRTPPGTSVTN